MADDADEMPFKYVLDIVDMVLVMSVNPASARSWVISLMEYTRMIPVALSSARSLSCRPSSSLAMTHVPPGLSILNASLAPDSSEGQ